ncbi:MAG TPA: hypothetical protein VF064_03115, partial [Pyrinomonadaceae bacterium]
GEGAEVVTVRGRVVSLPFGGWLARLRPDCARGARRSGGATRASRQTSAQSAWARRRVLTKHALRARPFAAE